MLHKMKSLKRCMLFLPLVLLLMGTAPLCTDTSGQSGKNVLVLNSYSPGYQWTDEIITGITRTLAESKQEIRVHQEFMDTKRVTGDDYFRLLYEVYRFKFTNSHFDAIITSDNDAFNFMVQYRDRLFPGTPVVFCGVNEFDPSQLHGEKLFTGVNEAPDLVATLDLALKLHPKTREVVVINDTTTTGRAVHMELMRLLPAYRNRVKFVLLENVGMQEITSAVQTLPPDSLVLFTFFFRDKYGRMYDIDQSIAMVAQHTAVPIYGAWDFNLGHGIVGGRLTSGYDQGRTAGQLVLRVLGGETVDNIPFVMTSPNRFMFDHRQLRRFGIKESALPAGSIIVNRPPNIYTLHRGVIWGAAAALVLLILIIILLLRNMELKRRDKERLSRLNDELEDRVRQRTEELEKSRNALEYQNSVLQETYRGLQGETEERLRVMEELRMKDQLLIQQSRMAAMGEMLGNIAHQWRQPLNLLGLQIQELLLSHKRGKFSEELLEANVTKAMEILLHLSRTIDDFRTFSTPDRVKAHFKVNEVIAKTVSLIGESFRNQGITIATCGDGDPEIEGYPNEYAQVLLNILMNSKDAFLERNIDDPVITVRSWSENGRSEVTISDNAGGIDESILEKIFDAYFTTKEAGKGTGVGLFMSKVIIEKNMGGTLSVRNTGSGVAFRITV